MLIEYLMTESWPDTDFIETTPAQDGPTVQNVSGPGIKLRGRFLENPSTWKKKEFILSCLWLLSFVDGCSWLMDVNETVDGKYTH